MTQFTSLQTETHFIKLCLTNTAASVRSPPHWGKGEDARGRGNVNEHKHLATGRFLFPPQWGLFQGKNIVFDLSVPIQHIQPNIRNIKAAESINNKTFSCSFKQLKQVHMDSLMLSYWGPGNLIRIELPVLLCLITTVLFCQYGTRRSLF